MNRKVSRDSYGKMLVHYFVLIRLEIGKHIDNILGVLLATFDWKSLSFIVLDVVVTGDS